MNPAENLTRKGKGRPKGSPNKLSRAAKDVIAQVADDLGGADRLLKWVKADPKNEAAYWERIYPKLLPLMLDGKLGVTVNWPLAKPKLDN